MPFFKLEKSSGLKTAFSIMIDLSLSMKELVWQLTCSAKVGRLRNFIDMVFERELHVKLVVLLFSFEHRPKP